MCNFSRGHRVPRGLSRLILIFFPWKASNVTERSRSLGYSPSKTMPPEPSTQKTNLDLPTRHIAHYESEEARQEHHRPETKRQQVFEIWDDAEFAIKQHQRYEDEEGVQVVVHGEAPNGIANTGQRLFRVDGI